MKPIGSWVDEGSVTIDGASTGEVGEMLLATLGGATTRSEHPKANAATASAVARSLHMPHLHRREPRRFLAWIRCAMSAPATIAAMEIMGIDIRTVISDNVATRCDGCLEIIPGTPWRVNLLDIVATESPVDWTDSPLINPGPFQFHGDPGCVRRWMAARGHLFCRRGEVREIMRPVPLPGDEPRFGLCDGIHRDDHEFIPA
jgi:hypothetical protein